MPNLGAYGYPLPPNAPTRVAPAEWRSFRPFLAAGSYIFTVPLNVYQIMACATGGGGNGGNGSWDGDGSHWPGGPGGGGGWAQGIIDVTPGQQLTLTVGASPVGTSSVGTILTATGGGNRANSSSF